MPNDVNLELVGAHLLDELAEQNPQIANDLKKLIEEYPDFLEQLGGADIIGTLFTMNDEDFEQLQDALYQAMVETFQSKEFTQEIITMFLEQGITVDTIDPNIDEIITIIDSIDELSSVKKEFMHRIMISLGDYIKSSLNIVEIVPIPCEIAEGTTYPTYAKTGDAGVDLYSNKEYTINPGETVIIPTGIKVAIPEGYALLIQPRSGQSAKTKLRIANTPGLIDSGYRDEIGVIVENIEPPFKDIDYEFDNNGEIHIKSILHGQAYTIGEGDRFAQMRLVKVPQAHFIPVASVENIGVNRGGGFGHTGQ